MSKEIQALRLLVKTLEIYENARSWADIDRDVVGLRVEWNTGMDERSYEPLRARIEESVREHFRAHIDQALAKLLGQVEGARQGVAAATIDDLLGGGRDASSQ